MMHEVTMKRAFFVVNAQGMLALDSKEVADTRDDISKLMDRSRKNSDQKSSLLALYPGLVEGWNFWN